MKSRLWMMGLGLCLALAAVPPVGATDYYVDDGSNTGDVWTPAALGIDSNDGLTPATPKATLGNLIGTVTLNPGDVVYVDTGTYAPVVISNAVAGAAGNLIRFQGSTNFAAGGTVFAGSGNLLTVRGSYLDLRDLKAAGGTVGLYVDGAANCSFIRVQAVTNSLYGLRPVANANSNAFRNCLFKGLTAANFDSSKDNYIENCVFYSPTAEAFSGYFGVSNMVGNVIVGATALGWVPTAGSRNIFYYSEKMQRNNIESLADFAKAYTNWTGNTFADALFVNPDGLDFHVKSPAGFVSNGTWVVDPAVPYSPAIDFGTVGTPVGSEPDPNGGRINVGVYAGTVEASKSRTGDWTYAMAYNDGGSLLQTGRLEWVASTNLAGANVVLEYSTNGWSTTNAIATVPATNEFHVWVPGFSHPAVQWRVRDPASGFASTNVRPFSVRASTNAAFTFYVNDGSTAGDVYCSAVGSDANLGVTTNGPKRSLQAILNAYDLEGGDTVYVDTGDYSTNVTTIATAFDSGAEGRPVRIIGSPAGSKLSRGSISSHTLEFSGVRFWTLENLQLADGSRGFSGSGSADISFRNVWFTGNQYGVVLSGAASGHVFDRCVARDNSVQGLNVDFNSSTVRSNRWLNGIVWGSPTLLQARTNTLAVSNSILGNGTWLLGNQPVPAGYNVVWGVAPRSDIASFTALQEIGLGWSNCVYADPLFANATNGDFHMRSPAGRWDTNLAAFVTTDASYSPAIDFGDPAASVSNEPPPNGSRLNAGLFGGTAQASKSRTNAWILLTSFRDGGTLDAQAGAWVRWTAGQYEPGATVAIWLSRDNGESWEAIATNVAAADGHYYYQVPMPDNSSSREALLRIDVNGAVPAASSQSPTNFTYRNGTFAFYVNDDSQTNDVYCSAIGNDANAGSSAGAPMRNLHALLAKLGQLGPGDRIYVDTGVYAATNAIVLTSAFSGSATNPVVIAGSTNAAAGGSLFRSSGVVPRPIGFDFRAGAAHLVLRDVALSNVVRGVALAGTTNVTLDGVEVRGATSRAFDLLDNARSNELVRCVAHGGSVGLYLTQVTNVAVRHATFWENSTYGVYAGASTGLRLENSVLASTATNAILISIAYTNGIQSDYNGLHAGPLTRVGENRAAGAKADNLAAWQRATGGLDLRSVPGDPLLADPNQYDYNLKTKETLGRRLPNGQRTTDAVSSPLLDAGNPASTAWTNEPSPNGGRVNIGKHGGTWAASIAPSLPWLQAASFGDAGSVSNGTASLVWIAGGGLTTQTVAVGVSVDGGKTWTNQVAAGIPATNGWAEWTVDGLPDTPAGTWRVVLETDTNVWSQSTNFFAIRNNPLNLYVATPDTNEAVYVSGPGAADNWMATPGAPLNSLRAAFERFDLEPGDRIWVDPGTYEESEAIRIWMKDAGTSNNPVRVTGDTNRPYAGTVFKRSSRTLGAFGIHLLQTDGVVFDSFMVSNAYSGIQIDNAGYVALERVRAGYCVSNAIYATGNTRLGLTRSILEQSLFNGIQANTGSVVQAVGTLMRDNGLANVNVRGGHVDVFNGILEASGSQRYVYYLEGAGKLSSDYNNVRVSEGANVGGGAGRAAERFLIDWQIGTSFSNDVNSSGYAADFADAAALDFHLKSQYGRFDPVAGAFVTNDATTSRLIDLGAPPPHAYSAYSNEPAPNGSRVNVGLYGNTAEASKSSGLPTIVPLTMSDGGTIRGNSQLFWSWNGFVGNELVRVLFSADGGATWTNVATNVYLNVGSTTGVLWRTTNFLSTAQGVWRVELEADTNVCGQTETLFAVKNDPLAYYVNDGSQLGDVYCMAIGRSTNTGLTVESPLNSLATLLGRYKVDHGDTVYVDTGIYALTAPLEIRVESGSSTNYLVFQGSTNEAAGGTVITNSSGGAVVDLQYSRNVEFRDLRLHGGGRGLLLTESSSNRFLRVRSVGSAGNGFELSVRSDQNRFIQCAALNFSRTGFHVVPPPTESVPSATNHWYSGVIASVAAASNGTAVSTGALLSALSGRIYVSNSVFVANGPAHVVFNVSPNVFQGNYNAYYRPYTNLFARVGNAGVLFGIRETGLTDLNAWQAANPGDTNSFEANPLFADLAGGDLHPQSAGGRYVPATSNFVVDAETSPLVDTADPFHPYAQESAPNGNRANLGVYGNTPQASRTPAEGTFVLLDYNQGGIARGTNTLRWIPRGAAFTTAVYNVYVKISTNSGASYQTVSTNPALAGAYVWDTTAFPSVPTVRWQVQCVEQLAWTNQSERDFAIHNSGVVYYVNDGSPSNDVFTSATGSADHTGLAPDLPLPSLADVLDRYDLEPGDEVRIDTGLYEAAAPVRLGYLDSGTPAEPVVIRGSPDAAGTWFTHGLLLENARGLHVKKLRFQAPPGAGATIRSSEDVTFEEVDVWNAGHGFFVMTSSNVFLRNVLSAFAKTNGLVSEASFNTRLEFGTLWSNAAAQVVTRNIPQAGGSPDYAVSSVSVSNSILGAYGTRVPAYEIIGNLRANYNNLFLRNGALAALSHTGPFSVEYDSVGSWASSGFGQDGQSLSHDPLFVNAPGRDLHLRSAGGRWVPALAGWTNDAATSPLIDAGDPLLACTEPGNNGSRANIGRYGNTAEASQTPTNGALTLISFNDGGRASGTNVVVQWNARGAVTNGGTVSIWYSADGGSNWTMLATNVLASAGAWVWDTTGSEQSVQAYLRLIGSDGSSAQSTGFFAVRNSPFTFYVNDNSTTNDVYCDAVGNNSNSGLSPLAPMADLNSLLAKYDLEGGDVVYVDTGLYTPSVPWRISQADSAGTLATNPVVFQGSTNSLVNGTVIDRNFQSGGVGIQADYAIGIQLRNFAVSNALGSAVAFNNCYGASAEWVAVGLANVAFNLNGGSHLGISNCVAYSVTTAVNVANWDKATNTVFPVIQHNVFWGTAGTTIQIGGQNQATVRNNILSVAPGQYVYGLGVQDQLFADYNAIWLGAGGRVFRRELERTLSPVPLIYDTVGSWAAATGQDAHSFDTDPLLVDVTNRIFQLRSRAGRWVSGTNWVIDSVTSPLIDAGDPASAAWQNEPAPNGGRVNIGLYGGTPFASKSETNSTLRLLTLNRGGVASGQVALNWTVSGAATGHTVRVEVSLDNGATWPVLVAAGIPASLGGLLWNSSGLPSSPLALWRVVDETDPAVGATSELNFVLKNGPVVYYVNDESQSGDVYTSARGSSTNTGATADSPKRWISEILAAYNLEPGDVIYVDTGLYQATAPTTFGELDAGGIAQGAATQVNVVGSTNRAAGGSRYLLASSEPAAFHLNNTYGIRFSHLSISGASNGLFVDESYFIGGDWLNVQGCHNGVSIRGSSSNFNLSHSALSGNQNAGILFDAKRFGSMDMGSCVLWSNRYGIHLVDGFIRTSNNVFGMARPRSFGMYVMADASAMGFQGDYNNLYVAQPDAAVGALQTGSSSSARTSVYASVSAWTLATGQESHSLAQDPQLADPGSGDFHPKSRGGRFLPGVGWVIDSVSSPLIDAGHPQSMAWTAEPDPNGRRLNVGLYGGSPEASKTPLSGWITQVTLVDGGSASGNVDLRWAAGGAATNYTVRIEYSPDAGLTWTNVVVGWPAATGSYLWNSEPYGRSAQGLWRIGCVEDDLITATSISTFLLRNGGTIPYYVNDASTNGDVYCTAPGDNANHGLTPNRPKASLQAILDAYELAAEDVVYVDAGTYVAGAPPIAINQTDSGVSNLYVTIQGSTNPAARTVFQAPSISTPHVFALDYAVNVRLRNLTIRGAQTGIRAYRTIGCVFDRVRIENNRASGLALDFCENTKLVRSILWQNNSTTGGVALVLGNSTFGIENSVLWDSPVSVTLDSSALTVTNSVLEANGVNGRVYLFAARANAATAFRGDYNAYVRRNGALLAEQTMSVGGNDYYGSLPGWSALNGSDRHSMALDPEFANAVNGDFHPKSPGGRFVEGTRTWTNDLVLSPLVDAGSAAWPVGAEPAPNGDIVNIGAYGGTAQASMTQTNPWLRVVSYNDEGVMSGNVLLYWLHGGMPPDAKVTLQYSTDLMINWTTLATNLSAASREYSWDVSGLPLSLNLNWRVVYEGNTNVWDFSDQPVVVKSGTYDYYVNDNGPTNLDVYCTGPGLPCGVANPTNRQTPVDSLVCLFANYPVGAGDRVFVDTGSYTLPSGTSVTIRDRNTGTPEFPLLIQGSTNYAAGGSLLQGNGTANGLHLLNTRNIEVRDLRLAHFLNGVLLQNVSGATLERLDLYNNATNGLTTTGSSGVRFRNGRVWANRNFGYVCEGLGGDLIENCTFWGNARGAVWTRVGVLVSNSILCATNAMPIFVENGPGASVLGDFNLYDLAPGAVIGTNTAWQVSYAQLSQWQARGRDLRSFVENPRFVKPASGDFHLQSRAGYWSNGVWAVSTNTSWAIDAGNPAAAATNEPAPNGNRLNLGAYGNTPQASLSDTNSPALLPITLRDGGTSVNGQEMYWLYRGLSPTNTIRIEYSPDAGATWLLAAGTADGLGIDSSPYAWFSEAEPSPEAYWRIVLLGDTNVVGTTSVPFTFRPRSLIYYVNDDNDLGDVYTTGLGAITNRGYVSNSPLPSIQAVLNRYPLAAGDEIRVDTGTYVLSNGVVFSVLHSGNSTNRVVVRGSPNHAAGGSVLIPSVPGEETAITFYGVTDMDLADFRLVGFSNGVAFVESATRCRALDLDVQSSSYAGIRMNMAGRIELERVCVREGGTNGIAVAQSQPVSLDGCVVWSNRGSAIVFGDSVVAEITNTVLEASGPGRFCYESFTNVILRADYNDLVVSATAQVASINGIEYPSLPQWVASKEQDRYSLSADPLFHDPANGDFHPRSAAGRYQVGVGWTNDASHPALPDFSPLIDMGKPQSAWSNEPMPSGNRRNIGLHGNTPEASKSNTNRWLLAVTGMGGGIMSDTINLVWGYGGAIESNELVRLEYSSRNGEPPWIIIGENIAVGAGQFPWNSKWALFGVDVYKSSSRARWRVSLMSDPDVQDDAGPFGLRNKPFKYYVNDGSTTDDVYTTAPGNDENYGDDVDIPKLTLIDLLGNIDLEPTDQVFIDTGIYVMEDTNQPIVWASGDAGLPGQAVEVYGSTHASGSWFVAPNEFVPVGPDRAMLFMNASHVSMRGLRFGGESLIFNGHGLVVSNLVLTNRAGEGAVAMRLRGNDARFAGLQLAHANLLVSGASNRVERMRQRWGETELFGTNAMLVNSVVLTTNASRTGVVVNAAYTVISNCTVLSSRGTAVGKLGAYSLRLGHSILVAGGGDDHAAIAWTDGDLFSDWNDLVARNSSWVGIRNGRWETLAYWQAASGQDANSVSFEPRFANELTGDLHLQSAAGRWSQFFFDLGMDPWDYGDADTSPLIDLGSRWIGAGAEASLPWGYRLNLGAYAGTDQASKSPTNFWLTALSYNDGGVVKGSNVVLRWESGNVSTQTTVALQYSTNGTDWIALATGQPTTAGSYVWDSAGLDGFNVWWRVVAEDGSGVADATDRSFAVRNTPQNFYVGDDDIFDNVFCFEPGSAAFDGLTPNTPKASLQQILDQYDLEGGDVVYVDTGTYSATADVRVIWSRSGSPDADVVVQGNPNSPYATALVRSGPTNFPAIGIDVKASYFQLRDLSVRGIDRAVRLESNRNATVQGVLLSDAAMALDVQGATGTDIRNSGFWKTGVGINLQNTRTSVLENLTFARSSIAGIQLQNTAVDVLQNNVFIPGPEAFAYSIGGATSLLAQAEMDYNLYDFSASGSGFYAGASNIFSIPPIDPLRPWQLGMKRDYRSYCGPAGLADAESTGDFHPLSANGRWVATAGGGDWTYADTGVSWAVDHGNPESDFSLEPDANGGRINVGMYGNTAQASRGNTNVYFEIRSLDAEGLLLQGVDREWPMIWSAHLVDGAEWVRVEFSGDGGTNWSLLAIVPAYQEYYLWTAGVESQTDNGRWRVIGNVVDPDLSAASSNSFSFIPIPFGIRRSPYNAGGLMRFDWQGGLPGKRYQIRYSDDFGKTWNLWEAKYNGPAPINMSDFSITTTSTNYVFEDRTSYLQRQRWYRIDPYVEPEGEP